MLAASCLCSYGLPSIHQKESVFVTAHALTSSASLYDDHAHGALGPCDLLVNATHTSGPSLRRPPANRLVQCQRSPMYLLDELHDIHIKSCFEDEMDHGSSEQCVICLESLAEQSNIESLPCGHLLHEDCLWNLYRSAARTQGLTAKCPLCRIPLTGDAEAMVGVLADESSSRDDRVTAVIALAKMGLVAAPHAAVLVRHTRNDDAGLRSAAVAALGQMGEIAVNTFSAAIVERLGDNDDNVRMKAKRVLQEVGDVGAQILVDALMNTQSSNMIWSAARDSLETMGDLASRALAHALARKKGRGCGPAAKSRAILTLSHLEAKAGAIGTRALVALVSGDALPSVRSEAAIALGNVCKVHFEGQALGIAALAAALSDHDEEVRQTAATALAKLGKMGSPHITAMLQVLCRRQPLTQTYVLQAVGKLGELCYAGKTIEAQLEESFAIFTIPCLIVFARLLNDSHSDVRRATLDALQRMGVTGAIALASQVYKNDKDPDVADLCREALQKMCTCGSLALACHSEFSEARATIRAAPQHGDFNPCHLECAHSLASKIEALMHAEHRRRPSRRSDSLPSGARRTNSYRFSTNMF